VERVERHVARVALLPEEVEARRDDAAPGQQLVRREVAVAPLGGEHGGAGDAARRRRGVGVLEDLAVEGEVVDAQRLADAEVELLAVGALDERAEGAASRQWER